MNGRRALLQVARVALALAAVALMMPLSYFGYLMGGAIGAGIAESVLGPARGVVGIVLGSVLLGGASILLPALIAVRIDRFLAKRLAGDSSGVAHS